MAEDKFEESKQMAEIAMQNLLENDVCVISIFLFLCSSFFLHLLPPPPTSSYSLISILLMPIPPSAYSSSSSPPSAPPSNGNGDNRWWVIPFHFHLEGFHSCIYQHSCISLLVLRSFISSLILLHNFYAF